MTSRTAVQALTITDFLAGPGGRIARRLGLPADLLAGCDTWAVLDRASGAHAEAVAACILRRDA